MVGKVVKPMFEPMGLPIDMFVNIAKIYRSVDVDFVFHSTGDLPPLIRENLFKEMNQMDKGVLQTDADREIFQVFCDNFEGELDFFFIVPDMGYVNGSFKTPGLSGYFKTRHWEKK